MILKKGMRLVLLGTALDLLLSPGVTRLLSSLPLGVSTTDPLTALLRDGRRGIALGAGLRRLVRRAAGTGRMGPVRSRLATCAAVRPRSA
jgi:hypothetical protein